MNPVYGVIVAAVFGLVYPAAAHHSAAMFDLAAVVTLQGNVTGFEWTNPNVYINVEVSDGNGQLTQWEIEGDPTSLMIRSGWTATTLAPGDVVTDRVNPARRTERTHARLVSLVTKDGAVLTPRSRGNESTVRATGIAGVWDGIRAFAMRLDTVNAEGSEAGSGGAVVQVGSFRTEARASEAWQVFRAEHSEITATLVSDIQEADLGERGIWYRLRIGPFDDNGAANIVCNEIKTQGGNCFVAAP